MNNSYMQKVFDRNRELVIKRLLPDTCIIRPNLGSVTISAFGVATTTTPEPKLWRGKETIPCRLDLSRAFRPAALPAQALEVDEYNLHLPFDAPLTPTDRIIMTHEGEEVVLIVRKMKDLSNWDITIEATVSKIGLTSDDKI